MRTHLYLRSLLLATGLTCSLAAQAQTTTEEAAPGATPTPTFQPATLLKLGTGLTRGLTIGGFMGTALPVVFGVERQFAPAWSAYGNVSSAWRIGSRNARSDGATRSARLTELGLDLGVRRYYNQDKRRAAGRATGAFVGNYVALQTTTSFTPAYAPKLYHEVTALSALWGMQRRLGGHGLLDAYVGGGLETRYLGRIQQQKFKLDPHLQVGVKLSLVL